MLNAPLIPLSQRGYIYFIEHARVEVEGGCIVYRKDEGGVCKDYNIPYVNTAFVILGEGTSITRDAARKFADAGVIVGFAGGGGSPLVCASDEAFCPLEPQNEYRPTSYMQKWAAIFFDEGRRLAAAKGMVAKRLSFTQKAWAKNSFAADYGLVYDDIKEPAGRLLENVSKSKNTTDILVAEAEYARAVFRYAASIYGIYGFTRNPGDAEDTANRYLDHLNYLAYGAASSVLHTLGISFSFPLLHGKTRRGALVFDLADVVKDGLSLPCAFASASSSGVCQQEARNRMIHVIHESGAFPYMFDTIKEISEQC